MGPKQLSFVEWGHQRAHQQEQDSLIQKCLAVGSSSPETWFPCGHPRLSVLCWAGLHTRSPHLPREEGGLLQPGPRWGAPLGVQWGILEASTLLLTESSNLEYHPKGRPLVCQKSKPQNHDLFSVFNWGASLGLGTAFPLLPHRAWQATKPTMPHTFLLSFSSSWKAVCGCLVLSLGRHSAPSSWESNKSTRQDHEVTRFLEGLKPCPFNLKSDFILYSCLINTF